MSSINFVNAYLLLIAIPLAALFIVPLCVALRKENANFHNITSVVLHSLMAVILAFAMAGTQLVTVVTETEVYVVADVSYSARRNLDTIDSYITKVKGGLPRNSKMGIVCFGRDAEVLTEPGQVIKSVKTSHVDGTETNIVEALQYTGNLFRTDVIKRIVLITDGQQSDQRNLGSLTSIVENLKNRDIYVDAVFLNDNLTESDTEVQVQNVEYTRITYRDSNETANVTVRSNFVTDYTATLYCGEKKVAEKIDSLKKGYNFISFDLDTSEQGQFDYKVVVQAENDQSDYNNTYSFTQTVSDSVQVLIISENQSDIDTLKESFEGKASVVSYLNDTNKPNTTDIPFTVEQLCKYDEIVLSNVDVRKIKNYLYFVESLDTVVSVFGKSLITIGDTKCQQLGEDSGDDPSADNQTRYEALKGLQNMLPVNYYQSTGGSRLFTLVIDTSSSMMFNYKMIIAKQAARYIVNSLLRDDDYICIITFDSEVRTPHLPTPDKPLSECREEVINKINNLDMRTGTVIGSGLKAASRQLSAIRSNYSNVQVMLVTDGLQYLAEGDDPIQETKRMTREGIVTSVLDVGRGYESSSSTALTLLKGIAENGLGGYYYVGNSLATLEGEVFGQMADDRQEDVMIRVNSLIHEQRRYDAALKDIDIPNDTYVSRYFYSKAKPDATVVLNVDYKKDDSVTQVPLYAYKPYGKGMVATFTSGLDQEWLGKFKTYEIDKVLLNNIYDTNVPHEKIDYPFVVEMQKEGKFMRVELSSPTKPDKDAVASINVTNPAGEQVEYNFTFATVLQNGVLTSLHYCEFELPSVGKYDATINYANKLGEYKLEAGFDLPYTAEYDVFMACDASALHTMLGANGKVLDINDFKLENDGSEVSYYIIDLTIPLLVVCAAIWVIDVAIRKLKWQDIRSLFIRTKKMNPQNKR